MIRVNVPVATLLCIFIALFWSNQVVAQPSTGGTNPVESTPGQCRRALGDLSEVLDGNIHGQPIKDFLDRLAGHELLYWEKYRGSRPVTWSFSSDKLERLETWMNAFRDAGRPLDINQIATWDPASQLNYTYSLFRIDDPNEAIDSGNVVLIKLADYFVSLHGEAFSEFCESHNRDCSSGDIRFVFLSYVVNSIRASLNGAVNEYRRQSGGH